MAQRILIIEDDKSLAQIIGDNLRFGGFEVECVHDGELALGHVRSFRPDLVLLDLMLPGRNGLDLCAVLRQAGKLPIVILSARSQKADKLAGLNLGADDYVTKPFDVDELTARVKTVLRRARPVIHHLTLGSVDIDFRSLRATRGRFDLHLTHREFEVLRYLAERAEHVVHRNELLRELWGYLDAPATTRSVDHTIARLRKKLEPDPHHPRFIRTAHGDGYCLSKQPDAGYERA